MVEFLLINRLTIKKIFNQSFVLYVFLFLLINSCVYSSEKVDIYKKYKKNLKSLKVSKKEFKEFEKKQENFITNSIFDSVMHDILKLISVLKDEDVNNECLFELLNLAAKNNYYFGGGYLSALNKAIPKLKQKLSNKEIVEMLIYFINLYPQNRDMISRINNFLIICIDKGVDDLSKLILLFEKIKKIPLDDSILNYWFFIHLSEILQACDFDVDKAIEIIGFLRNKLDTNILSIDKICEIVPLIQRKLTSYDLSEEDQRSIKIKLSETSYIYEKMQSLVTYLDVLESTTDVSIEDKINFYLQVANLSMHPNHYKDISNLFLNFSDYGYDDFKVNTDFINKISKMLGAKFNEDMENLGILFQLIDETYVEDKRGVLTSLIDICKYVTSDYHGNLIFRSMNKVIETHLTFGIADETPILQMLVEVAKLTKKNASLTFEYVLPYLIRKNIYEIQKVKNILRITKNGYRRVKSFASSQTYYEDLMPYLLGTEIIEDNKIRHLLRLREKTPESDAFIKNITKALSKELKLYSSENTISANGETISFISPVFTYYGPISPDYDSDNKHIKIDCGITEKNENNKIIILKAKLKNYWEYYSKYYYVKLQINHKNNPKKIYEKIILFTVDKNKINSREFELLESISLKDPDIYDLCVNNTLDDLKIEISIFFTTMLENANFYSEENIADLKKLSIEGNKLDLLDKQLNVYQEQYLDKLKPLYASLLRYLAGLKINDKNLAFEFLFDLPSKGKAIEYKIENFERVFEAFKKHYQSDEKILTHIIKLFKNENSKKEKIFFTKVTEVLLENGIIDFNEHFEFFEILKTFGYKKEIIVEALPKLLKIGFDDIESLKKLLNIGEDKGSKAFQYNFNNVIIALESINELNKDNLLKYCEYLSFNSKSIHDENLHVKVFTFCKEKLNLKTFAEILQFLDNMNMQIEFTTFLDNLYDMGFNDASEIKQFLLQVQEKRNEDDQSGLQRDVTTAYRGLSKVSVDHDLIKDFLLKLLVSNNGYSYNISALGEIIPYAKKIQMLNDEEILGVISDLLNYKTLRLRELFYSTIPSLIKLGYKDIDSILKVIKSFYDLPIKDKMSIIYAVNNSLKVFFEENYKSPDIIINYLLRIINHASEHYFKLSEVLKFHDYLFENIFLNKSDPITDKIYLIENIIGKYYSEGIKKEAVADELKQLIASNLYSYEQIVYILETVKKKVSSHKLEKFTTFLPTVLNELNAIGYDDLEEILNKLIDFINNAESFDPAIITFLPELIKEFKSVNINELSSIFNYLTEFSKIINDEKVMIVVLIKTLPVLIKNNLFEVDEFIKILHRVDKDFHLFQGSILGTVFPELISCGFSDTEKIFDLIKLIYPLAKSKVKVDAYWGDYANIYNAFQTFYSEALLSLPPLVKVLKVVGFSDDEILCFIEELLPIASKTIQGYFDASANLISYLKDANIPKEEIKNKIIQLAEISGWIGIESYRKFREINFSDEEIIALFEKFNAEETFITLKDSSYYKLVIETNHYDSACFLLDALKKLKVNKAKVHENRYKKTGGLLKFTYFIKAPNLLTNIQKIIALGITEDINLVSLFKSIAKNRNQISITVTMNILSETVELLQQLAEYEQKEIVHLLIEILNTNNDLGAIDTFLNTNKYLKKFKIKNITDKEVIQKELLSKLKNDNSFQKYEIKPEITIEIDETLAS